MSNQFTGLPAKNPEFFYEFMPFFAIFYAILRCKTPNFMLFYAIFGKRSKENENFTAPDESVSKKPKLASTSVESNILQEVPAQKNIPSQKSYPPNEDDDSKPSVSSTIKNLPVSCSEWMRKSVERWNLHPPYSFHTDELWKQYYQERATLDWRNENAWDEAGQECPKKKVPGERFKSTDWYDRDKLSKWDLDWE